jgi:hypothetical protein
MVNKAGVPGAGALVAGYVAIALGTVVALAVMSSVAPELATDEAWGHAVIVAISAIVLPLRFRSARAGNARAWRAVGVIAAVLLVVNVVEAALPEVFPGWMRVQMAVVAVLMAALVVLTRTASRG